MMFGAVLFLLLTVIEISVQTPCGQRWYKIYENDAQGRTIYGHIGDLRDAVKTGAAIRVAHDNYITSTQNAAIVDGNVCAQALFHISKNGYDKFQDNVYWWFVTLCTTGHWQMARYNVGEHVSRGNNEDRYALQWFARQTCATSPILGVSESGNVVSGSVAAVIEAVKNAEDIRIVTGGSYLFPADNLEYDLAESKVGAMGIWHVSQKTKSTGGTTINTFQGNDYWWFLIISTNGMRQMSRWNVGEHVSRGASSDTVSAQWFSDPCWKMVYEHDEAGKQTCGSLSSLVEAVASGHRVRVVYKRSVFEASELFVRNGELCATVLNNLSKSNTDTFQSDTYWVWKTICTTGTVKTVGYKVGANTQVGGTASESESMAWYIDKREWKKVLTIGSTGSVTSGSKSVLVHALRNGAELRYRGQESGSYFWVRQADNVAISGDDVGAMHVRSISLSHSGNYEIAFQSNPYWFFTIVSTPGRQDMSRWTVGQHTDRGHTNDKAAAVDVEWFVNE